MPTRSPRELKSDTQRAVQILQLFTDPSKGRDVKMLIPKSVLRDAHGIVFIRLYRIGFMLSAKSGTGVIIARLPDGSWSAPSAVSMNSVGFGHQAGGEIIDSIIVMNYRAAVKAFFDGGGQLQLGVGASLAVGPMGRAADVSASASSTTHIAATYAYSASKGLYIGYSFEGSKISERVNTNAAYYGRPISAREILTGVVPPPQDAAQLYDMLNGLGAGPRPGLPFAPQKDKQQFSQQQQMPPLQHSYTAPQHTQATQPSVNYSNRPPTTADGFEEPPPPYDGPPPSSSAPVSRSTSFNKAYMSNNSSGYNNGSPSAAATAATYAGALGATAAASSFMGDTKQAPSYIYGNQSPPSNNGKAPVASYNGGSIHNDAVSIQRTGTYNNNSPYNQPSSSSSAGAAPAASILNKNSNSPPHQHQKQAGYAPSMDKELPPQPPAQDAMTVVIAKYDYKSDNANDLSFSAGDTIIVTKRLDDRQAWWEGEIGTKRGFFPANYTEELTDD